MKHRNQFLLRYQLHHPCYATEGLFFNPMHVLLEKRQDVSLGLPLAVMRDACAQQFALTVNEINCLLEFVGKEFQEFPTERNSHRTRLSHHNNHLTPDRVAQAFNTSIEEITQIGRPEVIRNLFYFRDERENG